MRRFLLVLLLLAGLSFPRAGGGCFLPGTMVATPAGEVPIQALAPGQYVLSFTRDGAVEAAQVSEIYSVHRDYYYHIRTDSSEVNVTAEHPFYVGGGYKEASALEPGDILYVMEGGRLVPSVVREADRVDSPALAYNLRVDGPHTFFADGFAVHNKGGCFTEGTQISCPDGPQNISDLVPGDSVYSFYHGSVVQSTVEDVYALNATEYYDIVAGGQEVNVTAEHPFYTGSGFVQAQDLHVGDTVCILENGSMAEAGITSKTLVQLPVEVFNLHVSGPHTFFADGFAVHNKGGCFPAGTMVSTAAGDVPIQSISAGDTVLSFENGTLAEATVAEVYSVERDHYFQITTDRGSVNATGEHPFYIGDDRFREAQDLRAGDRLFVSSGQGLAEAVVLSVERVDRPVLAYNLRVDGPHTFFADGFAVHNKGGGGGSHSSGPPPNVFYYDCNQNFNDSGTQRQCCRQTSSTHVISGQQISSASTPYCICSGSAGNQSKYPGTGSCYCANTAQDPRAIPSCPLTLGDILLYAVCAVPLIVFIFLTARASKFSVSSAQTSEWSSTIAVPKDKVYQKAKKVGALLSLWGKVDPLWQEKRMKGDASAIFLKMQECWSKRDYTEMQGLMQPPLYSQHVAQLEAMKARHEINRMDGIKLLDLQLILVSNMHDRQKDSFTAWVRATAKDTIIDDRTGEQIRGDSGAGVFEEFWSFRRDGDAWKAEQIDQPEEGMDVIMKENFDSISTPEMLMRQYEKAGGPKIKDLGVASTREQDESAAPQSMGSIKEKSGKVHRLLNFLADQDRMWDEDKLVSFTRSVFIALNVALETKNLDPVRPSMEPGLFGRYQGMVDDLSSKGERLERRNLAVRDVEIVLVKNYYDNRKDSFTAWVSGQAQTAVTDEKTGSMVQGDDRVADFEEFWTFQREGDQWKLSEIEKAYSNSSIVGEENVDEGSDRSLMEFYYSKDRAV